jgi:hypothetical protein
MWSAYFGRPLPKSLQICVTSRSFGDDVLDVAPLVDMTHDFLTGSKARLAHSLRCGFAEE